MRAIALALCALMLVGCSEDPVSPKADPMDAMYGTYQGTFSFRFNGGEITQDPMTLTLGVENSATIALSGSFYPTTVGFMGENTISMSVNFVGTIIQMQGTRAGGTINGTSTVTGQGQGSWTVSK